MLRRFFLTALWSLCLFADPIDEPPASGDWIELQSREWIGGTLKAVYLENVEFNSYTLGQLSLSLEQIRKIVTRQNVTLKARPESPTRAWYEGLPGYTYEYYGTLTLDGNTATIHTPRAQHRVARSHIVSVAPYKELEVEYWSGKATAGLDLTGGNSDSAGFNAIASLSRRSAQTRLRFDYIGMVSEQNSRETVNNHRLKQKFDLYMTHKFYLTPITGEILRDLYQNIDYQWRLGTGVGVGVRDDAQLEWDLSVGPAMIGTHYRTVEDGNSPYRRSWALQFDSLMRTHLEYDVGLSLDYRFTVLDVASGGYRHHLLTQFSRRLIGNIDLDLSLLWNYLHRPVADSGGQTPQNSDFQLLLGVSAGF